MFRRSILLTFLLMMFGSGVGVAVAALVPQSADFPASIFRAPWREAPHIDALPEVAVEVPSGSPSAPPAPEEPDEAGSLAAVQRRLAELKYYVGPVDGSAGGGTRSAVLAFQKVNRLGADGVLGPATLAALDDPVSPRLRGGPARRVEIDLDRQVLYYVEGGRLARILPISSGNGSEYEQEDGDIARSLTPVGTFTILRKISGVREADLGTLYDPMYFYQGWAIHGSNSVPAYPASHGCVRVSRTDALWLFGRLPVGTSVTIYGGQHTFVPGSSAPGTTTPTGDGPTELPPGDEPDSPEPEEGTEDSIPQPSIEIDESSGSDQDDEPVEADEERDVEPIEIDLGRA